MKIFLSFLLGLFIFANGARVFAQDLTVILLRHAEKDTSPGADKVNPDLNDAGRARAKRLAEVLKKYEATDIFSSDFTRTRLTVAPLAEDRNVAVQIYDHKKLEDVYDRLMKSDGKTVVIVGHNNSTPTLANMLIKQEKYKILDESVYNKIWVIKVKDGVGTEEVIEY